MLFTHTKPKANKQNKTTHKTPSHTKKEKRSKDVKLKSIPIIGEQTSLKLQNTYEHCTLLI